MGEYKRLDGFLAVYHNKRKSEEFVLWNKPLLSLNDILQPPKSIEGNYSFVGNWDKMIKIAKAKKDGKR
jgi:hypothetical protein